MDVMMYGFYDYIIKIKINNINYFCCILYLYLYLC
jgi:hypothetical protein